MSKIAKIAKKPLAKKKKEPLKVEYSVNEPDTVYVTTTQLKNRLGEVLDLALVDGKEVILTKHGRADLKVTKIKEESSAKKLSPEEINKKYAGSIPDLEIDPDFRKDFNESFENRLNRTAKLLSDDMN